MPALRRSLRELRGSDILIPVGVAVLYVLAAKLGLALAFQARQVSAVWPPAGLALASVFWFRRRAVPGVLLGAFFANAMAEEPVWVAAGIAVGNTLEALLGAAILERLGFDPKLSRPYHALSMLAAAAASPPIAATIGVTSLVAGGVQPSANVLELWSVWWLGDALGDLVVAPLLLVWMSGSGLSLRRGAYFEGPLLLAGLFAAAMFAFVQRPPGPDIKYLIFPFLIWAAIRFGPAATVTVTAITYAVAVWATHMGFGPFAGAGSERGLVPLQLFMAVVAMTGLLLGAIAAQRREGEEKLRRHAAEMAQTDRRKDEFLAMLAHELRNPLAPIVHATELLERKDPAMTGRAKEIIRRQSEHLTKLVDDLLDVSRITRGAVRLDIRRVSLADAIAPAIDTWRHEISDRGQELSVDLPERPLWIEVDPTRLAQSVSNLLHNAIDFTPRGGRIAVSAAEENGALVLRVRDSGAGMTSEVLQTVFELFVQGPPPEKGRSAGLGLGLTLVRRLVELHGGEVEARSEGLGRGSEFVIRLPSVIARDQESAPEAILRRAAPAASPPRGRRVLVVDDNVDAREAARFLLEDEGHEVRTAGDGPEALREAESRPPDVVLLDIGLPGMDGYEVARRLRGVPGCADALIVAVSGYGQAEDRARSKAAGFDDHLLKPVAPDRLLDLVRDRSRSEERGALT